jgi:hypothetical protein
MTETHRRIDAHTARRASVIGEFDPRTLVAYLARKPLRSTTKARVVRALHQLGLDHLIDPGDVDGER